MDIRSGHVDDDVEKIASHINGLRSRIQDEISFMKLESVEETYQYALKAEEILTKKHEQTKRGRGGRFQRGRGRSYGEGSISNNLCKIKENLNGRMMTKERPSGKVVIHTKEVLVLTEEEVILILEVDFMVIV